MVWCYNHSHQPTSRSATMVLSGGKLSSASAVQDSIVLIWSRAGGFPARVGRLICDRSVHYGRRTVPRVRRTPGVPSSGILLHPFGVSDTPSIRWVVPTVVGVWPFRRFSHRSQRLFNVCVHHSRRRAALTALRGPWRPRQMG